MFSAGIQTKMTYQLKPFEWNMLDKTTDEFIHRKHNIPGLFLITGNGNSLTIVVNNTSIGDRWMADISSNIANKLFLRDIGLDDFHVKATVILVISQCFQYPLIMRGLFNMLRDNIQGQMLPFQAKKIKRKIINIFPFVVFGRHSSVGNDGMKMNVVFQVFSIRMERGNHTRSNLLLGRLRHDFHDYSVCYRREFFNAVKVLFNEIPYNRRHSKDDMAVINFEKTLGGLLSPFINVPFATSTAHSAITAEMSELVLVTISAVVGKESFARIIAEKHMVYFLDLFISEEMAIGRFIFLPIILVQEDVPHGIPWLWIRHLQPYFSIRNTFPSDS